MALDRRFDHLYESTFDDLYRFVRGRVGAALADDIVSEAYLKALRAWGTVRGNERAWLYRIAINTMRDHFRRAQPVELTESVPSGVDVEAQVQHREERRSLELALERLTEDERTLIDLRFMGELRYGAIAQALGATVPAVKMRTGRTLKKLRAMLEGGGEPE